MSLFFPKDEAPGQLLPDPGPQGPPGPTGPQGPAGASTWNELTGKPTSFAPSAHKASHATGGSDAIAPSDIGAATAAQGAKADTALQGNVPSIIDVNSTSPALRITQTGSGNALVVEDSTHPDSTPFFIDNFGNGNFIGNDSVLRFYTPTGSHYRIGVDIGANDGNLRLWNIGTDPNVSQDTNLVLRRINNDPNAPIVLNLRQSGNHDANDNWLFTGNVSISGSLTASAIATAITSAAAPITAGSVGSAGSIRYDADYIYICTATNTWRRTAITSW